MRMAEKYPVRWFEVTDSTNNRLLADRGGQPSGTVYAALFQTAGRGRLDHKWLSAPGENLIMSVVLDVAGAAPDQVATLPLLAGLAAVEGLSSLLPPPPALSARRGWRRCAHRDRNSSRPRS